MTNRRWLQWVAGFLCLALLVGAGALALMASIVRSPAMLTLFPEPYMVGLDAPFRHYDPPCEVLIYGDSTAATGQDPGLIESATGLRTCNVAGPVTVITALDTMPVDAFLAINPKPKYLVLHIGPETLWGGHRSWEGIEAVYPATVLLRHASASTAMWALASHLRQTIVFAEHVLQARYAPSKKKLAAFHRAYDANLEAYREHGLLTMAKPPEVECELVHAPFGRPPAADWVAGIRKKYESEGIRVIVKVSDVPQCDQTAGYLQDALKGISDGPVVTFPTGDFNDYDRHFTLEGARLESLETVRLIQARQAAEGR